jgi:hypothetical protein
MKSALKIKIAKEIRLEPSFFTYTILKRSIDSRKGQVNFVYSALVETSVINPAAMFKPIKSPSRLTIPIFAF